MKTAQIKHYQPSREYFFIEGCHINELSNNAMDPAVSIAQARVEPGMTTQWHRLKETTERYVILSGEGHVEVGNLTAEKVQAGDVVLIPPYTRQRITNTGAQDLIFLAICSPRFEVKNYCNLS